MCMSQGLLREYISRYINEGRSATLSGQNQADIAYAINWLRLNKVLKNASNIIELPGGGHSVVIKFKGDKKSLIDRIKSRFGSFVTIK
jgi:hypothetical protein